VEQRARGLQLTARGQEHGQALQRERLTAGAAHLAEPVDGLLQLRLGLGPPPTLKVEGPDEALAERDGAGRLHPLRLLERLIDGDPDLRRALLAVQVVLPQAEVDVEGLVDVQRTVGERLPGLLVRAALLPGPERVAG